LAIAPHNYHKKKKGTVKAAKLGTTNEILLQQPKRFAAATKIFCCSNQNILLQRPKRIATTPNTFC